MDTLKIRFTDGSKEVAAIEWPVVKRTEKACLVQTSGGEIWLPTVGSKRLPESFPYSSFDRFCELLGNITKDDYYPVSFSHKGPTDKSAVYKFVVNVVIGNPDERDDYSSIQKKISRTLPKSQTIDDNGHLYAPCWLLNKKLIVDQPRKLSIESHGYFLPKTPWRGLAAVLASVAADLDRYIREKEERAAAERTAFAARWEAERPAREAAEKAATERRSLERERQRLAGVKAAERKANPSSPRGPTNVFSVI